MQEELFQINQSEAVMKKYLQRFLKNFSGAVYIFKLNCSAETFSENFQGEYTYVSSGVEKIFGYNSNFLKEDKMIREKIIYPEEIGYIRKKMYQSFIDKKPYQLIYKIMTSSGEMKWIWDEGEILWNEKDQVLHAEGIIMDLSVLRNVDSAKAKNDIASKFSENTLYRFEDMVGKSEAMQKLFSKIKLIENSTAPVLILGETGSGKELVAKAVHKHSTAANENFIPVNCGAIPEHLLESEFFGYKKGAFTGATSNQEGFISAANNGTLFLDEVGELPLNMQVKLLRVLETKTYTPLGSNTPVPSSFRLIAATNRDLAQMVKEGKIRSDFYYRINVILLKIPPLRERPGDIPLLLNHYLIKNKIKKIIPLAVRLALEQYPWPGNIRELYNFLDKYCALGELSVENEFSLTSLETSEKIPDTEFSLEQTVNHYEKKLILKAMEKVQWKQAEAAKFLQLNLRTLQRKLKKYNISKKSLK